MHVFTVIILTQTFAGLQDPLLGQTSQYSVMKSQKFVQILHNNRAYWVAISTHNCKNSEVNYYDSYLRAE